MDLTQTIAAVATAPGTGGVGIIRISGSSALDIGLSLFTPAKPFINATQPEPNRLYFGRIASSQNSGVVDKGYFVFMKAPLSFTGEDVVELHCHGGPLLLKIFLEGVLQVELEGKKKARLAEPGEFTKRAFLNGKLELSEAEAVIELISATTECALAMAGSRLHGALARKIAAIKERLVELVTYIEAELDFAEEEIDALTDVFLNKQFLSLQNSLDTIIKSYAQGSALARGVKVVITGRPNTGKSSLLNRLLKEERAIVTPVAGTTRDVIEESVVIKGLPVRLMDTAGLRGEEVEAIVDEVEAIGIERARQRVRAARVVLFVVDASASEFKEDNALLQSLIQEDAAGKAEEGSIRNFIIVANKSDKVANKAEVISNLLKDFALQNSEMPMVAVSAQSGEGLEELEEVFYKGVTGYGFDDSSGAVQGEAFITTLREKDALVRARDAVEKSMEAVDKKVARECLALELRGALDALDELSGETTSDDILNRIFSGFCIGK